ncbi:MAG: hypothetical protein C3F06_02845 [Candidatus Methanoperedenaceae archaeon]|nr:MAG: hypothetical protein C3F06_02845 [Candidatus Methanoperedenaceae archaeon]
MAGYTQHEKIAEMAGIPSVISQKINRFMNDMNPPEEFEDHNAERKIFVCGHLNVSIRTMMGSEKLIDRGKKEWIQKEDLKWLLETRKEYIKCYYLYLAVDNICENKVRIKGGKETIENCINSWGKNSAVVIPGTEPYLRDVMGFLRSNAGNIRQIIIQE